ncbi:MAG: cyanophycinase [Bryobacterales bacterium]|nr:cyanophycinase [Bryobacterales bacterium]
MRKWLVGLWALAALAADVGPDRGSLVVVGGGRVGPGITQKFLDLAGGPDAVIVWVPTAGERDTYDAAELERSFLKQAGAKSLILLHTRSRDQADSEEFAAPLKRARGVWFAGGRQWRLVDSYLGTRTEREFRGVVERGGVIGGTSAGATIQGFYLVRGAREGNQLMMAPGYEQGFGFLRGVAIDQHLLKRNRQDDLLQVIDRRPDLLGIGIDESTAIVVQGDRLEVIGESKVAIYDKTYRPGADGKRYYFLEPGARFDLKLRRSVARP